MSDLAATLTPAEEGVALETGILESCARHFSCARRGGRTWVLQRRAASEVDEQRPQVHLGGGGAGGPAALGGPGPHLRRLGAIVRQAPPDQCAGWLTRLGQIAQEPEPERLQAGPDEADRVGE